MDLIVFETAVVARRDSGELLLALMDGAERRPHTRRCVGLFSCAPETAEAMCRQIGSALKTPEP